MLFYVDEIYKDEVYNIPEAEELSDDENAEEVIEDQTVAFASVIKGVHGEFFNHTNWNEF